MKTEYSGLYAIEPEGYEVVIRECDKAFVIPAVASIQSVTLKLLQVKVKDGKLFETRR